MTTPPTTGMQRFLRSWVVWALLLIGGWAPWTYATPTPKPSELLKQIKKTQGVLKDHMERLQDLTERRQHLLKTLASHHASQHATDTALQTTQALTQRMQRAWQSLHHHLNDQQRTLLVLQSNVAAVESAGYRHLLETSIHPPFARHPHPWPEPWARYLLDVDQAWRRHLHVLQQQQTHLDQRHTAVQTAMVRVQTKARTLRHQAARLQQHWVQQQRAWKQLQTRYRKEQATVDRLNHHLHDLQELLKHLPSNTETQGGVELAQLKGQLPWPVAGAQVLEHQGATRYQGRIVASGTTLSCPPNSPVRPIATGRVVYAGRMAGYGHLVIVQHGHRDLSLYGHNAHLEVKEGAWVHPNDVLARTDTDPHRSRLYLGLRHGSKVLNPEHWLKYKK